MGVKCNLIEGVAVSSHTHIPAHTQGEVFIQVMSTKRQDKNSGSHCRYLPTKTITMQNNILPSQSEEPRPMQETINDPKSHVVVTRTERIRSWSPKPCLEPARLPNSLLPSGMDKEKVVFQGKGGWGEWGRGTMMVS